MEIINDLPIGFPIHNVIFLSVELIGERDARVIDRCARLKSNAGCEPTSHRIGLGDCA